MPQAREMVNIFTGMHTKRSTGGMQLLHSSIGPFRDCAAAALAPSLGQRKRRAIRASRNTRTKERTLTWLLSPRHKTPMPKPASVAAC